MTDNHNRLAQSINAICAALDRKDAEIQLAESNLAMAIHHIERLIFHAAWQGTLEVQNAVTFLEKLKEPK